MLWGSDSPYHQQAEPHMSAQWRMYLYPILRSCQAMKGIAVDLACGHGRLTSKLIKSFRLVFAIDVNPENVQYVSERFASDENVITRLCDGSSIPVADNSVDVLICWDAMVHFSPDTIGSYLKEIRRILTPTGIAVLHHSNISYDGAEPIDITERPHWRNDMSAFRFRKMAVSADLIVTEQRIISWGGIEDLDCITTLRRHA